MGSEKTVETAPPSVSPAKRNRVPRVEVAPVDDAPLRMEELEVLSAVLEDYVSLALQHARELRRTRVGAGASEVLHKWIDRAHELKERIEANLGR